MNKQRQRTSISPTSDTLEPPTPEQRERYQEAAHLLREWMASEDSYDEEVWPLVEEELKHGRMRCGERE